MAENAPKWMTARAKGKWEGGVRSALNIRNFSTFYMDEPPELGGTDQGPNPVEFILAALIGCESVMAAIVAKEMNFAINGMEFEASGKMDMRGIMGVPNVCAYFQDINETVRIDTPESDERVHDLRMQVECRCPVYTLLKAANVKMNVNWEKYSVSSKEEMQACPAY